MRDFSKITPEGTKDILFRECKTQRDVERRLADILLARGYNEVRTPGLEYYDVFCLDGASIPQQEMYKTTDNNGRLVVFRPDSTLPIARMAASRLKDAVLPIRLFYNQPVFRNRPDLSGKSNESAQIGIELLGAAGIKSDLEAISVAIQLLECIGEFRIEIGNAQIFKSLSNELGATPEEIESIRETIEMKNYAALDDILESLKPSKAVDAVKILPRLFGGYETLEEATDYCVNDEMKAALDYMKKLYALLEELGLGDRIMVDLGLVQRNDYYSGVIFSAYAEGSGDALLVGGRYDNLLEKFGQKMPAIGFSVDTASLISILMSKSDEKQSSREKKILHAEAGCEIRAQRIAMQCIDSGAYCEVSTFESIDETKCYAKKMGIEEVIIITENGEVKA